MRSFVSSIALNEKLESGKIDFSLPEEDSESVTIDFSSRIPFSPFSPPPPPSDCEVKSLKHHCESEEDNHVP
ncbi:MAG: hypothetical protein AB4368_32115 [Xenococcaceae cyanobacterium]